MSKAKIKKGFEHLDWRHFNRQNNKMGKAKVKEKKFFVFLYDIITMRISSDLQKVEFNYNNWRNFLLYRFTGKWKGIFPIVEMKRFKRIVVDFPFSESSLRGANEDFYRFMSLQTGIIITPLEEKERKIHKKFPFGWFYVKRCELLIPEDYEIIDAKELKHFQENHK